MVDFSVIVESATQGGAWGSERRLVLKARMAAKKSAGGAKKAAAKKTSGGAKKSAASFRKGIM